MSLKERITEDMKASMRSGDKERLAGIRFVLAAIKQRRESITQFEAGGRADLVAKETAELAVLLAYLPAQLSDAEVEGAIRAAIASTGATTLKDMGKVMAAVKPQVQGRTDMGALSARIKGLLSS